MPARAARCATRRVTDVSLALDAYGNFLAMRADNLSNVGARCDGATGAGAGGPELSSSGAATGGGLAGAADAAIQIRVCIRASW